LHWYNSGLDLELQRSFLKSKEFVYRGLADQLISQGRIPEAEQVLAMLKEEELYDFIRRRDGAEDVRQTRAGLTPPEQAWDTRYQRFLGAITKTEVLSVGSDLV
jgi:hypothetical protein